MDLQQLKFIIQLMRIAVPPLDFTAFDLVRCTLDIDLSNLNIIGKEVNRIPRLVVDCDSNLIVYKHKNHKAKVFPLMQVFSCTWHVLLPKVFLMLASRT